MKASNQLNRRRFLGATSTAAAAVTLAPRHVLGGPRHVPPSEKITVAYIGCGSQGLRHLMDALPRPELRIVAACDPNRKSDDYPEWGPRELRAKVRRFLKDDTWGEGIRGALCGREVGLELVNRHYGTQDCRAYVDVRELLDKEAGVDALYVMTPEHLHATITVRAMRAGKHAICHKPLSNVLREARIARNTARETGAATHMFCAAALPTTPQLREWLDSDAIGPVREVHNWSSRPFWPQGMTEIPAGTPPVPKDFDWDLWLGPAAARPYHPDYTHAVFRGWCDFGTGALGDMGHYSLFQVFKLLDLGAPTSVESTHSVFWRITNYTWHREPTRLAYPRASLIRWEFPARGTRPPVALHWYDGGLRPPWLPELETDGEPMPKEGLLLVGDHGKILADFTGANPRLIPRAKMRAFEPPPPTLPRPIDELDQWIRACRGGPPSDASFERVYPFAETILLGTIAQRVPGKLRWDSARTRFTDAPAEATQLLTRRNRPGWEI